MTTRWKRLLLALGGLLTGLLVAEGVFHLRDGGAFPHLNCYLPDTALGTRLRPGATQKISFSGNPITSVRINSQGLRGPELPPASAGEVLVVGDSQVFGLGVEEGETFSAQLSQRLGRNVVNAGIPTYGPDEYAAKVEELLPKRKSDAVVFIVNLSNDLFEAARPNRERHTVWDGWAVRSETAPARVSAFPGREWLFSQSHLVFALRGWWHGQTSGGAEHALPSEGTWRDLAGASREALSREEALRAELSKRQRDRQKEIEAGQLLSLRAESDLDSLLRALVTEEHEDALDPIEVARAHPGDIVNRRDAESARPVRVTAEMIKRAAEIRANLTAELRRLSREDPEKAQRLKSVLASRAKASELAEQAGSRVDWDVRLPHPLDPVLARVQRACRTHGARLVVAVLPLDVMTSPYEWEKYGGKPFDLAVGPTLVADTIEAAHAADAEGVDLLSPLRMGGIGSFLQGDLHMSAKGHGIVAEALETALKKPRRLAHPKPGLPEGRTPVPTPAQWDVVEENFVKGSTAAGCETKQIREWLRVSCRRSLSESGVPTGVELVKGRRNESLLVMTTMAATLVTPVLPEDEVIAVFHWSTRSQRLVVGQPENGEATRVFERATAPQRRELTDAAYSKCFCNSPNPDGLLQMWCERVYGQVSEECDRSHRTCDEILACMQGDPWARPRCPEGWANAGATFRCAKLCDAKTPCETGTCTPWHGAEVCW